MRDYYRSAVRVALLSIQLCSYEFKAKVNKINYMPKLDVCQGTWHRSPPGSVAAGKIKCAEHEI